LVLFSYFALTDLFWAVPRAPGPVFMFCAPGVILGGTKGAKIVFMFCVHELVLGSTKGVGSRFYFFASGLGLGAIEHVESLFHILRSQIRSRQYRGRRGPFSCFALPDSFSTVPWAWGSHFHVLRSRTHFQRYRGRMILLSCFSLSDTFSAVLRASDHVFMFCAPESVRAEPRAPSLIFMFHAPRTRFGRYRGRRVPFSCFTPPVLVFVCTEGVGYHFRVLRSWTHFRWYRGRRVPFSCFALPDSFSAILRASSPIFMFCAPETISGGTGGVEPNFQVSHPHTLFRRYRGCRVQFSCFALPNSCSAVPRASGLVFMFCGS
jgi:hypothetical protein